MSPLELAIDTPYPQSETTTSGKSSKIEWSIVEEKRAAFTAKHLHLIEPRIPPQPEQHMFFTNEIPWRVVIKDSLYNYREMQQRSIISPREFFNLGPLIDHLNTLVQKPAMCERGEVEHASTELFWETNLESLVGLFHTQNTNGEIAPIYLSEINLRNNYGTIDSLVIFPDLTMYVIDHYHVPPNSKMRREIPRIKNRQLRKHKDGLTSIVEEIYGEEILPTIVTLLSQYRFGEKENEVQIELTKDSKYQLLPHIYEFPEGIIYPALPITSSNG